MQGVHYQVKAPLEITFVLTSSFVFFSISLTFQFIGLFRLGKQFSQLQDGGFFGFDILFVGVVAISLDEREEHLDGALRLFLLDLLRLRQDVHDHLEPRVQDEGRESL